MKKLVLALLLMQAPFIFAAKPSSNPADYPILVHVVVSRFISGRMGDVGYQELDAIIDGQQVELQSEGGSGQGVLALGDYKAQLSNTNFIPKRLNGYDTFVVYRFLLPDGTIRDFDVVGLGPKADTPSAPTHP
ncbi:hypothetical protein [Granulicella mallensis]|uniref:Uncharacterized protein n=1 Tax=Granulicella mallensis TaxID=940614 RepID=A0A7W8EBZ8_9BACT|nr:hypothetical protein [Granulicella mallensis]MBB5065120.1 hypothetical protein [Granulicella mallensis]